jgi:hypothetical protein
MDISNLFRLPLLTATHQIQWVKDPKICRFLQDIAEPAAEIDQVLEILLTKLAETPNRLVISACTAYVARIALNGSRRLHNDLAQSLKTYHPSAALDIGDVVQLGLEIVAEPQHILQGFNRQNSHWYLALEKFIRRKYALTLVDRIRQCSGAKNFKRTNNNLIVRMSAIKAGEALQRAGSHRVAALLLLQRAMRNAVKEHGFSTESPKEQDYDVLLGLYQQELTAQHLPKTTLAGTIADLQYLGQTIRSYDNMTFHYLDESMGVRSEQLGGNELLNPLESLLQHEKWEHNRQLQQGLWQQLRQLSNYQRQSLVLSSLGFNDAQVGRRLGHYPSTVKRQRDKLFLQVVRALFPQLALTTKSVHFPQIAQVLGELYKEYCLDALIDIRRDLRCEAKDMATKLLVALQEHWNVELEADEALLNRLKSILEAEGFGLSQLA